MPGIRQFRYGRLAEWSMASVLKTEDLQGSGGSNPSPSAKGKAQPCAAPFACRFRRGIAEITFGAFASRLYEPESFTFRQSEPESSLRFTFFCPFSFILFDFCRGSVYIVNNAASGIVRPDIQVYPHLTGIIYTRYFFAYFSCGVSSSDILSRVLSYSETFHI